MRSGILPLPTRRYRAETGGSEEPGGGLRVADRGCLLSKTGKKLSFFVIIIFF